ncbi:MAG: TolC family protein, partial [Gammaproteobacteria bacterium]|nr:TolC family protein [Gammaproteobacteria bacterium]
MAHRGRGAAAKLSSAVACAVLAASGCKVGPDFHRPATPVEEHWIGEAPGTTAEPADTTHWWRLFNDPTLDSLIDTAFHNNLSLQVAAARILQAQAQLAVAVGELFPQQQVLAGEVQHQRQSQATLILPALNPDLDTSQLGVSASWELDFWGKYRR